MKVSVIVVTWNGLPVLQNCIGALARQTLAHELVVVDNGSHDGTLNWLTRHVPSARVVASSTNLGFAGGNNAGLRAATGDYLVLVNNDTIAEPDFLEHLIAPLAGAEDVAATAGVLTFAHRPAIVAAAGIVAGSDGLHRDLLMLQPVSALPEHPVEIFGASGGAVCYRRPALHDVGLFDEGFFNYLEDADLAWRLRLRNWRCMMAPAARIRHIYSATGVQGSPFKQRLLARNRIRVLVRCFPGTLLRRHGLKILRYDVLAVAYSIGRRQPATLSGRVAALRELPALIRARRQVQARRTSSDAALERWLRPPVSVGEMLAEQRALTQIVTQQHAPENVQNDGARK